jgi:hypothetical protein
MCPKVLKLSFHGNRCGTLVAGTAAELHPAGVPRGERVRAGVQLPAVGAVDAAGRAGGGGQGGAYTRPPLSST